MGAKGAVQVMRGAAGLDLGGLIKLDFGHFYAGEAEGPGVVERSGESGGVDGGDVQTILYREWFGAGVCCSENNVTRLTPSRLPRTPFGASFILGIGHYIVGLHVSEILTSSAVTGSHVQLCWANT